MMFHMKTATVRDLRQNFPKIELWLAEGEPITITKRDKPVALLSPPPATHKRPTKAQIRARWSQNQRILIKPGTLKQMMKDRHREFEL